MQIWLYFHGGAGGDSVANLLEHCHNVATLDGLHRWRVHRYVDGKTKFWAPCVDQNCAMRQGQPFVSESNRLESRYLDLIEQDQTIIVTSHDVEQTALATSDCKKVLLHNRINIWIRCRDEVAGYRQAAKKNLKSVTETEIKDAGLFVKKVNQRIAHLYQQQIYFEDMLDRWSNCTTLANNLGLELDQSAWQQWRTIVKAQRIITGFPIHHYQSRLDEQGRYQYDRIEPFSIDKHQDN